MNMKQSNETPVGPKVTWEPQRVEQLWRGAIAGGAGLSLLAVLWDQLRSRRRAMQADKGQVLEGEPATINLAPSSLKIASPIDWAGGAAVAAGTYWLIQKAYKELRKKQLAQEIAEADEAHTQALAAGKAARFEQSQKVASGMFWELLANSPKNTFFIPAVLAAGGAYGLLENTWPRVSEKGEKPKTKKIVVKGFGTVHADGAGDGPLAELDKQRGKEMVREVLGDDEAVSPRPSPAMALDKAAFVVEVGEDDHKNSVAMLGYLLAEDPRMYKRSALLDLVAAHYEAPDQVRSLFAETGPLDAAELSKGARFRYADWKPIEKRAAWHAALQAPSFGPSLAVWTLAELEELNPDLRKRAQAVVNDPWAYAVGTKCASLFWSAENAYASYEGDNEKVAALQESARKQMETLDLLESDDSQGNVVDTADSVYSSKEDPIDNFLLGRTPNAQTA